MKHALFRTALHFKKSVLLIYVVCEGGLFMCNTYLRDVIFVRKQVCLIIKEMLPNRLLLRRVAMKYHFVIVCKLSFNAD